MKVSKNPMAQKSKLKKPVAKSIPGHKPTAAFIAALKAVAGMKDGGPGKKKS